MNDNNELVAGTASDLDAMYSDPSSIKTVGQTVKKRKAIVLWFRSVSVKDSHDCIRPKSKPCNECSERVGSWYRTVMYRIPIPVLENRAYAEPRGTFILRFSYVSTLDFRYWIVSVRMQKC